MKRKFTFFFGALLCLIVFISFKIYSPVAVTSKTETISTVSHPNNNISPVFLIGGIDLGWEPNYNAYQDLGFNVWHKYNNDAVPKPGNIFEVHGWTNYISVWNDLSTEPLSTYQSGIESILEDNRDNVLYTIAQRPKIEMLCYGQRSDYQCEAVPSTDDYWFYSFNEHGAGTDIMDGGQMVRYCSTTLPEDNTAGYVVERLMANNEQSNMGGGDAALLTDDHYSWHIKPRIRVDSLFVANPSNINTPICRVDILNFDGDVIRTTILKPSSFKENLLDVYHGNYMEDFFNLDPDSTLFISDGQNFNPNNEYYARTSRMNNETDGSCKADIKVYWYGQCDMWIDYVRVDNNIAHQLFSPAPNNFDAFIEEEAELMLSADSTLKIYLELLEFNHIPCVRYVNDKLRAYPGARDIDLMADFTIGFFTSHLQWPLSNYMEFDAEYVKRTYMDRGGFNQFFFETYNLTGSYDNNESFIPSTLDVPDEDWLLATEISPDGYDTWLQGHLDNDVYPPSDADNPAIWTEEGGFKYMMKLADEVSKLTDKPHLNMAQAHQWFRPPSEIRREPTVEETEMLSNLAISYGTRGILYFLYDHAAATDPEDFYGLGFSERTYNGGSNYSHTQRLTNVYGQDKWDHMGEYTDKVKKWSPYLMSFDNENRHSYIYRLSGERSELLSSTYFQDVLTYKPVTYEPPNDRYLQVSVFDNDSANSKYFMIVNRRCSPAVEGAPHYTSGGKRLVSVVFDANAGDFAGFNNWKIINVEDHSTVLTFDKTQSDTLDLGWFMPGEGKLFKIAPVMQEGGEFVTNEYVGAGVVCKGIVENDGYRLVIPGGSSVQFTPSGKIIMEGGSFFCGQHPAGGENGSVISGYQSGDWDGIDLIDCDTVKVYQTGVSGIAYPGGGSPIYAFDITNCSTIDISYNQFTGISSGAINAYFTSVPSTPNIVIYSNQFTISNNLGPMINFNANSSLSIPVIADGNQFVCTSSSSSMAIGINNISGGVIKNNEITNFYNGILASSSSVDLYNNTKVTSLQSSSCVRTSLTRLIPRPRYSSPCRWMERCSL